MLEGLHADEAKVLIDMKNKTLNKTFKGLTSEMVKEAFGWNADFVKPQKIHESKGATSFVHPLFPSKSLIYNAKYLLTNTLFWCIL